MNRRQLLTAAPALAFLPSTTIAAATTDPIIDLCRQYRAIDAEVERLGKLPGGAEYNTPEIEDLCGQREDIFRELSRMVPTSLEAVAEMACVLVDQDVGWADTEYFCPADWMQANLAKGARALIATV